MNLNKCIEGLNEKPLKNSSFDRWDGSNLSGLSYKVKLADENKSYDGTDIDTYVIYEYLPTTFVCN